MAVKLMEVLLNATYVNILGLEVKSENHQSYLDSSSGGHGGLCRDGIVIISVVVEIFQPGTISGGPNSWTSDIHECF